MRNRLAALVAIAALGPAARADDDAAALLRRADETTYLPATAGVKSLQCELRYTMTNGTVRRMAYTFTAGATPPSHVDRLLGAGEKNWDVDESEERYGNAIDGLVWKSWGVRTAGCELELRRDGDRAIVVVKSAPKGADVSAGDEIAFLPEGPVERFGAAKAKVNGASLVLHRTYDREGDRYVAANGVIEGYGGGLERWTYTRQGAYLLPKTYTLNCGGLGGTFAFGDWRVDEPLVPVKVRANSPAEELAGSLADPDVAVRLRAAGQLVRLGKAAAPAAPALVKVVRDLAAPETRATRDAALLAVTSLSALESCGPSAADATDTLVAWLTDDDAAIAAGALRVLVTIGHTPAGAVPQLTSMISQPWPAGGPDAVRTRWLVAAIWNAGPAAEPAIPALIHLFDARCDIGRIPREFKPGDFRDAAAAALATLGAPALEALAARLAQPSVELSDHFAGKAIAAMGEQAKVAVDTFCADLESTDATRRTRAIHALRNVGAPAVGATPKLLDVLRTGADARTRLFAAWALAWVATKDEAAAAAVVTAWRDGRISGEILKVPSRRTQMDDTMYAFAGTAVPPLAAAVREMKDDPRGEEAAYLLGHCGETAVPALAALAADPDGAVATRAIHGMGVVIGDAAVPELLKVLASADDTRAAAAIDALVVNSFPAKPALRELLQAPATPDTVKRRAEEALRRIAAK